LDFGVEPAKGIEPLTYASRAVSIAESGPEVATKWGRSVLRTRVAA